MPAWILGVVLLCVLGAVAARWLQAQSDSRFSAWVKYLAGVAVIALLAGARLSDAAGPLTLAAALIVAGAVGLRNAPTRRDVRIKEFIGATLAAARSALEAEASRSLDEADRQDELHRQARRALPSRDLSAFRNALSDITDVDRKRDAVDSGFRSLLIEAAEAGATDFVTALLARGAAVNQADTYRGAVTPLQLAGQRGHLSAVRALIEQGADVNARDQWGYTALWYAANCHGGHLDVVDFLLRSGADPAIADLQGRTPLDWATMNQPRQQNSAVVAALRAVIINRLANDSHCAPWRAARRR